MAEKWRGSGEGESGEGGKSSFTYFDLMDDMLRHIYG